MKLVEWFISHVLIDHCEYLFYKVNPVSLDEHTYVTSDRTVFSSYDEAKVHEIYLLIDFFEKHNLISNDVLYRYTGRHLKNT